MVRTWPATKTFDTLEACDVFADSFLTWPELQREFRRYYTGDAPPHYPVPATLGPVVFADHGYHGTVYINRPDGDDWVILWDDWSGDGVQVYRDGIA